MWIDNGIVALSSDDYHSENACKSSNPCCFAKRHADRVTGHLVCCFSNKACNVVWQKKTWINDVCCRQVHEQIVKRSPAREQMEMNYCEGTWMNSTSNGVKQLRNGPNRLSLPANDLTNILFAGWGHFSQKLWSRLLLGFEWYPWIARATHKASENNGAKILHRQNWVTLLHHPL